MPKYKVTQYYGTTKVFEVEAIDAEKASDKVSSEKRKPYLETGSEFQEEIIEEIE